MNYSIKKQITEILTAVCTSIGYDGVIPEVSRPENADHGEYTTNIAMVLAQKNKLRPIDIAKKIQEQIEGVLASMQKEAGDLTTYQTGQTIPGFRIKPEWKKALQAISRVEIAGPGFLNIYFSEAKLSTLVFELLFSEDSAKIRQKSTKLEKGKTIMVEFAHPNTHKAFHIGHLRNITIGECLIRLFESQGNTVVRANYQGDVGMHIAKALYALLYIAPYKDEVDNTTGLIERVNFLGKAYAAGSGAYESDEKAKEKIHDLNYLIYASAERFAEEQGLPKASSDYLTIGGISEDKTELERIYVLWKETRQWSLDYFDHMYRRVGTHYDRLFFESECLRGVDLAKEAVKKGILTKDEGAIIFDGKPYDMDTRVFVNSLGLPTYEGKELALVATQMKEFPMISKLIHVLGPEQKSFTKITFKAEELLGIIKPGIQYHLAYGWVKLKKGKMSSRTGQVVLGEWLIDIVKEEIHIKVLDNISKYKDSNKIDANIVSEALAIAAVKYSFLKVGTYQEIAFDIDESINMNGDSGPYLLYTYARCQSVLRKAGTGDESIQENQKLTSEERALARFLLYFLEIVAEAAEIYAPNILCTYLFTLAQAFNLFYQKCPILENPYRLKLTEATAQVLKRGLYLLGIQTVERM